MKHVPIRINIAGFYRWFKGVGNGQTWNRIFFDRILYDTVQFQIAVNFNLDNLIAEPLSNDFKSFGFVYPQKLIHFHVVEAPYFRPWVGFLKCLNKKFYEHGERNYRFIFT